MTYTILPLQVGTIRAQKSTLTYMRGFGQRLDVPILLWVLRDAGHTYLVDTGAHSSVLSRDPSGPRWQLPHQDVDVALGGAGVDPKSVELVVLSHLHYDHAGNCDLFPNAELVVQERELAYARDPLPVHRRVYDSPALRIADSRWRVIDGDTEIRPGITLLLTPGHTCGLQTVCVDTADGLAVIASDTVPLFENWNRPDGEEALPSGSFIDLPEYYRTLDRLAATGGRILPSHDPALLDEAWPQ